MRKERSNKSCGFSVDDTGSSDFTGWLWVFKWECTSQSFRSRRRWWNCKRLSKRPRADSALPPVWLFRAPDMTTCHGVSALSGERSCRGRSQALSGPLAVLAALARTSFTSLRPPATQEQGGTRGRQWAWWPCFPVAGRTVRGNSSRSIIPERLLSVPRPGTNDLPTLCLSLPTCTRGSSYL